MIKAGFYKQDLEEALVPAFPVMEERIEAIAMYLEDPFMQTLWITLDFMDFNLSVVNSLKESICDATGVDMAHIHVVTTHNHGGGEPDMHILARLCRECALAAKKAAVNVNVRYNKGECDRQVSIIRRKYVPELCGVTTLFFGATEKEGFDSAPFVENAVESIREGTLSYCGRRETKREASAFLSGDRTVFAIEFCDENDETVGTIVRFSAHAVCTNRPGIFTSDYPWHVRKNVETELDGICIFWNGPCADIAPAMVDKNDGTQITLGKYIADTALSLLKDSAFDEKVFLNDESVRISLPVRKEIIKNHVPVSEIMPLPLPERRKHLENMRYKDTLSFLYEKYSEGEEKTGESIDVSFGLLRLGKLCVAAFPGETFSTTASEFCSRFSGEDICTITEHGRTVMYMPPEEECELGGYESVCRVTTDKAEEILRTSAVRAYKSFK